MSDGIRRLEQIEHWDDVRKHLIRLAILKVRTTKHANVETVVTNADTDQLLKKCHSFELTINKMKQESITKERLNESKIEKLKDDLARARKQIKDQQKPPSRTVLVSNITPYLAKTVGQKTFLSPTASSRQKSALFSTLGVSASGVRSGVLSPVHPRDRIVNKPLINRGRYTVQKVLALNEGDLKVPKLPTANKSPLRSPGKTPSRLSFVENFDADDSDRSPSPEFTPTKRTLGLEPHRPSSSQTIDNIIASSSFAKGYDIEDGPHANSTSILDDPQESPKTQSQDNSDVFASANSSLDSSKNSTVIISKTSRKKRLNLTGSSLEIRNANKSLNLEKEGLDSVDYYKDDNIMELSDDSPRKPQLTFEKKKRKVFSIS